MIVYGLDLIRLYNELWLSYWKQMQILPYFTFGVRNTKVKRLRNPTVSGITPFINIPQDNFDIIDRLTGYVRAIIFPLLWSFVWLWQNSLFYISV